MPSYSRLLYLNQNECYRNSYLRVSKDIAAVYKHNKIIAGLPRGVESRYKVSGLPNSYAVIGMMWGDEGKGRIVDNLLEDMLNVKGIKQAYVIRFQGGSNAGHTVYKDGRKIALHQLPSGILYSQAIGVMDSGMVIHLEDLQTEIIDAEKIVGDLRGKLVLSEDAMLCTDLERAEEVFMREKSGGKSKGGTGRGMSQTVAHYIDRQGAVVVDLLDENWRVRFAKKYDIYERDLRAWDKDLATIEVPDFRETRKQKKAMIRKVGSKKEYLKRLQKVRDWFLKRDSSRSKNQRIIQNTFPLHQKIESLLISGHAWAIFEGAQAVGLHFRLGRRPDVTATDTSMTGIKDSTDHYTREMIGDGIGVFKATYDSSVGQVKPLTIVSLPKDDLLSKDKLKVGDEWKNWTDEDYWRKIQKLKGLSPEQKYAAWIREVAGEKGTTTGRYREICYLDLAPLRFNAKMGEVTMLAVTHLDIARKDHTIKVCTHYTDSAEKYHPYQPGQKRQQGLKPHYVELPGFDGRVVRRARNFIDLPDNAKKFLAFIQRQVGLPIIMVSTGPNRENALKLPRYKDKKKFFSDLSLI